MSQTANDPTDTSAGENTGYLQLSRMMRQGRSWSGRERNCCFLNTRDGRFATISAASGFDFVDDARAVALTDWDQDGDVDLWVSNRNAPRLRFLRNTSPASTQWLALRLEGSSGTTSRDAIGARVVVRLAGGAMLARTLRAGEGFLAQSSKWMHFGLGKGATIESVVVRWPGGDAESFTSIRAGRRYHIIEGQGAARQWKRPTPASAVRPGTRAMPTPTSRARIPLVTLTTMPTVPYQLFDGSKREPPIGQGKAVLINLWASWCRPCLVELAEFGTRARELSEAGIEVLALATDGLGDDKSSPAAAEKALERLALPFAAGRATEGLLRMLQHVHNAHLPLHKTLPLPSSFLVDGAGRLVAIYKGPVSVDTLIRDVSHSTLERPDRMRRAAPLAGSVLRQPQALEVGRRADVRTLFQLALDVSTAGRPQDARKLYHDALALKPDFVEAHNNLGNILLQAGELVDAERSFRRAIEIGGEVAEAWRNLGTVHAKRNELKKAESALVRALKIDAKLAGAWNALGLIVARQRKLREAAVCFEKEIALQPRFSEAYNNLGITFLQTGQAAEAIRRFETAIDIEPRYVEALSNLGVALLRESRIEDAERALRRALEVEPGFPQAERALQEVRQKRGG